MSPEQARGRALDKRTDIWSFGVILYECLTGRSLFRGETATDSMGAIMHKDPEWSLLPPNIPSTIQLLLRRCLTKDRERRLHDIADARIELENAIVDPTSLSMGLAASVSSTAEPHRRWSVGALAIGVILIVGVTSMLLGRRFSPSADFRVRKYEIQLHDHGSWNVGQPAISPDGTMVAFVDQDRLWIRHLDSWDTRSVEGSGRGVIPFWSPDSKWLAFGRGSELVKVAATGGRPILITKAKGTFTTVAGGAWPADGRIFFSSGDSGIFVVSCEGGVA